MKGESVMEVVLKV